MDKTLICTQFDFLMDEYKECLDFGNDQLFFDKGFISFSLLEIPDTILVHIKQRISHESAKLKERFCPLQTNPQDVQEVSQLSANDQAISNFLYSIYDEWIILNKTNWDWGTFLFFIPLARIQMGYRIHYGYKSYYETHPDYSEKYRTNPLAAMKEEFMDGLHSFSQHPGQSIINILSDPEKKTSYTEKLYEATIDISDACNSRKNVFSNSKTDWSNAYYEITDTFSESVLSGINEIILLKSQLKELFTMRATKIPKSFAEYPTWMQHSLNATKQLFNCLTLSQIVALEQDYLIKQQAYIKTCKMCGNYFVATKSNSAYCSRPNSEYGNRTCKELCKKAMPSAQYELFPGYNEKRKVYLNWINKQIEKHPELKNSDISKQLHSTYEQWNQDAVNAMLSFDNQEIDRNKALELIELPSIEDRSPMLYKLLHK